MKKYKLEWADGFYITGGTVDINFNQETEIDFPQFVCDALNYFTNRPMTVQEAGALSKKFPTAAQAKASRLNGRKHKAKPK